MLLVLKALLVLSVSSLLQARKRPAVMVQMKDATSSRGVSVQLGLDTSILRDMSRTSASDVANMSLSPWIYRDDCKASRLPMRISQAHCLTSGCLSPLGGQEDSSLEVKPIRYEILVLHRVQKQTKIEKRTKKEKQTKNRGKYEFVLGTQVVTVGCTCVRPAIIPQK